MNHQLKHFIHELEKELKDHPIKIEICYEYEDYIEQKEKDLLLAGYSKQEAITMILDELGNPKEIAKQFKPSKRRLLIPSIIVINYLLFICGSLVTIGYYTKNFGYLWTLLVGVKWFVLFGYFGLWLCISYVLGKQLGPKGKQSLKKALLISLIPNYVLMLLVLYVETFQDWFSFVSSSFLAACVVSTFLFYPLSQVSFKIGFVKGI